MPRLVILGTGTPAPNTTRWGSSFLLNIGDEWLMFDCGPAATYKLYKAGFTATQVDRLIFTHHHSDHDADYPVFLLTRFDMSIGAERELQVYGPNLTEQVTHRLIGEDVGAFWHDIVARTSHPLSLGAYQRRGGKLPRPRPVVHARDVGPGRVAQGKNWEMTAAAVEHVQPYLDSLAYRIDSDEGTIVFSGDTRPCDNLTRLAEGADLLVMECIRLQDDMEGKVSGECETGSTGAARTARDAGVKKMVLVHQSPDLDHPVQKTRAIGEIKAIFPGDVIWGEELLEAPW